MPGYVPVYIRPGDTPLEKIHLDLAESLHELLQEEAWASKWSEELNPLYGAVKQK